MANDRPVVDFEVEKPGKGIRLLVEAKNTPSPSPEWAARFLRNLFEHVQIPPTEYFLLALRDHFYLWRNPASDAGTPDFEAETSAALRPYLERIQYDLDKLTASSFELLIEAWLFDLVAGTLPEGTARRWAEDSGLSESVRGGEIRSNVAA